MNLNRLSWVQVNEKSTMGMVRRQFGCCLANLTWLSRLVAALHLRLSFRLISGGGATNRRLPDERIHLKPRRLSCWHLFVCATWVPPPVSSGGHGSGCSLGLASSRCCARVSGESKSQTGEQSVPAS